MSTVQIHAAWPKPCFVYMSMSILHVHVHVACPCQCCMPMPMSMSMFIYIEMSECRTVQHPVSQVPDWKKLTIPEQIRYRTKLTQSGIFVVQYRTKSRYAKLPMLALVFSMLMPRFACKVYPPYFDLNLNDWTLYTKLKTITWHKKWKMWIWIT